MADWAGTASDLTGYREYRAFINNPPNASDPGARWAGMPEFASSSQSARSVSASKVPLPSSNSTRYSRQSSTAARSNPSVSAGVASHAFRSSKFLGYSSNNPNAPWNYKPKPLSPSKIWLPMSSIRRLPTSYIGHGSSRFVDDDFGLKVFRKCEGYRTGQEPVQPYIPPPQWPPEPEHKLDEFTGPRPLKHAVVHHPTWQYQPEPRGARGDPASLFTDISKKRFRRALIAAHRVKLSFRRILGHGGFGLAALFQVEPLKAPRPGHPKQVVVKITMREGGANELLLEMKFHQYLRRSKHNLRGITPRDLFDDKAVGIVVFGTNIFTKDQVPAGEPTHGRALILEHMRLGTLDDALVRMGTNNKHNDGTRRQISEESLWRMFECLVKACVGMKYPPMRQPANKPTPQSLDMEGPDLPEVIPPLGQQDDLNIVHFDIDPKNVFIGDYEKPPASAKLRAFATAFVPGQAFAPAPAPTTGPKAGDLPHSRAPVFKLGDFGLAQAFPNLTPGAHSGGDRMYAMWSCRSCGKRGYHLPEQWTIEWDCYSGDPTYGEPARTAYQLAKPPSQIAGRYNEKSNIWHIGMAMHNAITHTWTVQQPWAEHMVITNPLNPELQRIGDLPPHEVEGMSHGWRLEHRYTRPWVSGAANNEPTPWGYYSRTLRKTIAQCLMHNPLQRPSLEALLEEVQFQVAKYDGDESVPTAFKEFNEPIAPFGHASWVTHETGGHAVDTPEWERHPNTNLENQIETFRDWQVAVGLLSPNHPMYII